MEEEELFEDEVDYFGPYGSVRLDGEWAEIPGEQRTLIVPEGTVSCYLEIDELKRLEAIELPSSLEDFRFDIDKAPSLKRIRVKEDNPNFKSVNGRALIDKRTDSLVLGLGYIPEDPDISRIKARSVLTYEDEELLIPKTVRQVYGGQNLHCRCLIIEGLTYLHPSFFLGDKLEEVVIKGLAHILPIGPVSNANGIRHRLTFIILNPHSPYRYEDGGLFDGDRLLVGSFDEKGKPIIPASTKCIGDFAFYGVKTDVIQIPDGVKRIGALAFCLASGPSFIWVGSGVRRIDFAPFLCEYDSQPKIRVSAHNPYIYMRRNCLIEKKSQTLLFGAPNGQLSEGVKRIAKGAFPCSPRDIYLPKSLKSIAPKSFFGDHCLDRVYVNSQLRIGKGAFRGERFQVYLGKEAIIAPSFFAEGFQEPIGKDNVFLSVGNPNYAIKDGKLFSLEGKAIEIPD